MAFDKFFIGNDITAFENNGETKPISRVTLMVDSDNAYTSGDDTGMELTATCIHATQAMADALLAKLKGKSYKMYTADDANLDPAAELGDGVTVGGIYSALYQVSDDGSGYPSISSPGEEELEDEYPASGPMSQQFERQLAKTRSLISKSSEEILLEVQRLDGSLGQTLRIAADGVTITNAEGGAVTIDGGQIKASSITGDKIEANSITADKLNITGSISFADLDSSTQTTINNASGNAASAYNMAASANSTVSAWTYTGSTYIDGSKIMTGTVYASYLKGGTIGVLNSYGNQTAYITPGESTAGGLSFKSYGNVYLGNNVDTFGNANGAQMEMSGNYISVVCNSFYPTGSVNPSLGTSTGLWSAVYAISGTIQTSDRRLKHDIEELPGKYITMLDSIKPVRYKMNNGTSDRYHIGYIAQDVEEAMTAAGIDSGEFGGFVRDRDADGEEILMLRYEEFIGILDAKIKQIDKRLAALEVLS